MMKIKNLAVLLMLMLATGAWANGITTRVSLANFGVEANADSFASRQAISADGRYIVFQSLADNLDADNRNGVFDIFVYDRWAQQTQRISANINMPANQAVISANGRMVAFVAGADIFLYDRFSANLAQITAGDGASSHPWLTADGMRLVFASAASNLVSNDNNGVADIFLYDLASNQISRISTDSNGLEANAASYQPSISADGTLIVFQSLATNLVANSTNVANIILVNLTTAERKLLTPAANQHSYAPMLAAGGQYVVFDSDASNLAAGDDNGFADVFLYELATDSLIKLSSGENANLNADARLAAISELGLYINYESAAYNLSAAEDRRSMNIWRVSRADGSSIIINKNSAGQLADFSAFAVGSSLAANGCFSSFSSPATNLVPNDNNSSFDVFLHTMAQGAEFYLVEQETNQFIGLLNLPTVRLPSGELYQAQLLWEGDINKPHFIVNSGSELPINQLNSSCSFVAQDASLLHIPLVNVLNPDGSISESYEILFTIVASEAHGFEFILQTANKI
jgi:Tol biopolymer transport system component